MMSARLFYPSVAVKDLSPRQRRLTNEFVLRFPPKDGGRRGRCGWAKSAVPSKIQFPGARSTRPWTAILLRLGSDGTLYASNCERQAALAQASRLRLRWQVGDWVTPNHPSGWNAVICTPVAAATMVALNKRRRAAFEMRHTEADDAGYALSRGRFSGVRQYVQFLAKGLAGVEAKTASCSGVMRGLPRCPGVMMLVSDRYGF